MTRGRRKKYQNPIVLTLKTEQGLHDAMVALKADDSTVYSKGAIAIAKERAGDLNEQQIAVIIQAHRQIIKDSQEEIMLFERLAIDAKVREQARKKNRQETRLDERGQAYLVVEAP